MSTPMSLRPRPGSSRQLAVAVVMGIVLIGCAHKRARSAEQLRDAHTAALVADDPAAAYALLSAEVQATIDYAEFEARWKADEAERTAAIKAAKELPPALATPVHGGTTVHSGGHVLQWSVVDEDYLVTDGLPGRPDTSTPAQAIRTFVAAVRRARLAEVEMVLAESLVAAIDEDWKARVDAIERALQEPDALDLSADLQRAELRYEPGRTLTLEQSPSGWRITGLR